VREAVACETPTVVFMVGGKPNSYEPFDWVAWKGRGATAVSRDDTGVDDVGSEE
jgi:hypothetical protein